MLAPHWLDAVFQNPDKVIDTLVVNDRFKEAITKAQVAYAENLAKDPNIIGGSPAQSARLAFLEVINAN